MQSSDLESQVEPDSDVPPDHMQPSAPRLASSAPPPTTHQVPGDFSPDPATTFPLLACRQERVARLSRLAHYTPELLEPLRTTFMTSPRLVEIPSRWFYFPLPAICGLVERAFATYMCREQPSLLTAFLTADCNILLRGDRVKCHHLRSLARVKKWTGGRGSGILFSSSVSGISRGWYQGTSA